MNLGRDKEGGLLVYHDEYENKGRMEQEFLETSKKNRAVFAKWVWEIRHACISIHWLFKHSYRFLFLLAFVPHWYRNTCSKMCTWEGFAYHFKQSWCVMLSKPQLQIESVWGIFIARVSVDSFSPYWSQITPTNLPGISLPADLWCNFEWNCLERDS